MKIGGTLDSLKTAHDDYQKMMEDRDQTHDLEIAIQTLEELKIKSEFCMEAYRNQFDQTLRTEKKFKKLELFVNELRVQTDTSSRFHPLFERAQSVLRTLSARDFEEIRSYRKPPHSVVLGKDQQKKFKNLLRVVNQVFPHIN